MELPTISLREFVERMKSDIAAFEKYWTKGPAADFPLDLPPGDWDEQLHLFAEQAIFEHRRHEEQGGHRHKCPHCLEQRECLEGNRCSVIKGYYVQCLQCDDREPIY